MLHRIEPVAWTITSADGWLSRQRTLEARHRAELRWAGDRPSLVSRVVARARGFVSLAPVASSEPVCCAA